MSGLISATARAPGLVVKHADAMCTHRCLGARPFVRHAGTCEGSMMWQNTGKSQKTLQELTRRGVARHAAIEETANVDVGRSLLSCAQGDLLCGVNPAGNETWLEVLEAPAEGSNSAKVASNGYEWELDLETGGLKRRGQLITGDEAWLSAFPGFAAHVRDNYSHKVRKTATVQNVTRVGSLSELEAAVKEDASLWRDGTGPRDAPLKGKDSALLTAGELAAFLIGERPVCMVQLHVGWTSDGRLPIWRPFALAMLRRVAEAVQANEDGDALGAVMSLAEADMGLTALLYRGKTQRLRAQYLADFGAQSSLVAQSPYYKLLIGRILGYKERNIVAHIEDAHGVLPRAVADAVTADLAALEEPGAEERMALARAAKAREPVDVETMMRKDKRKKKKKGGSKPAGKGFGAR